MTLEEKRLTLREKIAASKSRLSQHEQADANPVLSPVKDGESDAPNAAEKAVQFIQAYPIAVVSVATVIGLLLGSRGKASAVKAATKPAKKPNVIVTLLLDAAIAHGLKLIDKARLESNAADKDDA